MKKIVAIGASNSKNSINTIFATYIANQLENSQVTVLDWSEMVLPLYSPDLEAETGIPENAHRFKQLIDEADAIVLSLAEHNSLPTAAFKNLWDWTSRIEKEFWANKPMFLAAVSPGGRGGANVLKVIKELLPHFGGNIQAEFSLASFYQKFENNELNDPTIKEELSTKIQLFSKSI